jgi:hypothetical protein
METDLKAQLEAAGVTHPDDIACAVEYLQQLGPILEQCADGLPAGTIKSSCRVACLFMARTLRGHILTAQMAENAFKGIVADNGADFDAAETYVARFSPMAARLAQTVTSGSIHYQTIMIVCLETMAAKLR